MLITLTNLLAEYIDATKDDSAENITRGTSYINQARKYINAKNYVFREGTQTITTVAGQNSYSLAPTVDKVEEVSVTVSTQLYPTNLVYSKASWNMLQAGNTNTTSDQPIYSYIEGGKVYLYPAPASNGNTITVSHIKKQPKLSATDYITGTLSITSGATTVTGSGTTFTADMVGSYVELGGEGYEIASYSSTTSITIAQTYAGTTLSGAAVRIGDATILPDTYADLPWIYGAMMYYAKKDGAQRDFYRGMLSETIALMDANEMKKTTHTVMNKRAIPQGIANINSYPTIT